MISVLAGTTVTAETNGFSLNSPNLSSPDAGYSSVPDVTTIPDSEHTVFTQVTPEMVIPIVNTPDSTIQQPIDTEIPLQPNPTITKSPQVTDTPIDTPGLNEIPDVNPTKNESFFGLNIPQGEVNSQITPEITWSDPPLNSSASNPYYSSSNSNWVINESGHDWTMDLDPSHNTGTGVTLSNNTFSGFGWSFAILINSPDVMFDGMGAILDGGGKTSYGILVNNQSSNNYHDFSSDPANALGGINIKNVTLIGFTQAGIFFNNVIGTLSDPGTNPSSITNVNSSYNGITGYSNGEGIFLQNSDGIDVSSNTANGNQGEGVAGWSNGGWNSNNNTLIGNTANGNQGEGFYLGSNNTLIGNTANGNRWGGFGLDSNNTLTSNTANDNVNIGFVFMFSNNLNGNKANGNQHSGFAIYGDNNILNQNTANGNQSYGFEVLGSNTDIKGNTAIGNQEDGFYICSSNGNTLNQNTAIGNQKNGFNLCHSSNNNDLSDNTATGNQENGFYIWNSNNNTFIRNDARGQNIGFDVINSTSNTFTRNKGCFVWENSSFIPVDINYCTSNPSPSSLPTIPSWNITLPTISDQVTTNESQQHPYEIQFISSTIDSQLQPGQTFNGFITIKNTGTTAWTSEGLKFGLKPFGDALKFGIGDIMIPDGTIIEPGQEFSFPVTITAPSTPGVYDLQFRMFFFIAIKERENGRYSLW